jgi:hypothetical protein
MPQLETLMIGFAFNGQIVTHPPVMTPVTLPSLHHFYFRGHCTYLEALVHLITPCPEKLEICFPDQSTFSVPRLLQFMNATWNLKFESVKFNFSAWQVSMVAYPRGEAKMYALPLTVGSQEFDWLVSYVAQVSNSFSQIFTAVERLTLELKNEADNWWPSWPPYVELNGFNRIEWHQLLGSFSNVKTLRIDNVFIEAVSRCLQFDDGGLRLELLPELQELTCSGSDKIGDGFTSFIDARQNAGRPITLTRC